MRLCLSEGKSQFSQFPIHHFSISQLFYSMLNSKFSSIGAIDVYVLSQLPLHTRVFFGRCSSSMENLDSNRSYIFLICSAN